MKLSEKLSAVWPTMSAYNLVPTVDNVRHWADEIAHLEEKIEELHSEHLQNERMREWFAERTGLDEILLSAHMKAIDTLLTEEQEDA